MTGHPLYYCDFDRIMLQDGARPERLQAGSACRGDHDDIRNDLRKLCGNPLSHP